MAGRPHVYLNDSQIKKGKFVVDKETKERHFEPFVHSKTGDKYIRIILPSSEKRKKIHGEKAFFFGTDVSGIDRDRREAYIQVPLECVTICSDKKLGKKQWYFNNFKAQFTVYFKSERDSYGKFDQPEKVKIGIKELMKMFPASKKDLEKLSVKTKNVTTTKTTNKIKETFKKKSIEQTK